MPCDDSLRREPCWDIFCTVVDNFGDIGITWRLARQLAAEHGLRVRLWVDDLASFHVIRPEVDASLDLQTIARVEVRRWRQDWPDVEPADVVVEALACHLPEAFEQAMARRLPGPIWINLEYLSAEDWVIGCHGLPSPHPRLPLTKYFFMPGYAAGTGGVLKEGWLESERRAFQADPASRDAFWQGLGLPPETPGETRISLFSYESVAAEHLLDHWSRGAAPVRCLVPAGKSLASVARFLGSGPLHPGERHARGGLIVHVLPMLDQDAYDRLLWACDCNFVRGEDSFVRAQWARKPLVWQAYRQEDGAHMAKLEAFLERYCVGIDPAGDESIRGLWRAWNEDGEAGLWWDAYWDCRPSMTARATTWAGELDSIGDLAGNLVKFCAEKI